MSVRKTKASGIYGPDLAPNATWTASSTEGGSSASNVADGNNSTYWSSGTNAHPMYIYGDFGAGVTKAITKLVLYCPRTGGWARPTHFVVEYGSDGSNWTAAYYNPYPGNTGNSHYGNWADTREFTWPSVGAYRYWLLYIYGGSDPAGTTNWEKIERLELREGY